MIFDNHHLYTDRAQNHLQICHLTDLLYSKSTDNMVLNSVSSVIEDTLFISRDPAKEAQGYYILSPDADEALTLETIDDLIINHLSESGRIKDGKKFKYLMESYTRAQNIRKRLKRQLEKETDVKLTLDKLDQLIVGYGLILFLVSDFACEDDRASTPLPMIQILDGNADQYNQFLYAIIKQSIEEGSTFEFVENFFNSLVLCVSNELGTTFNISQSKTYNSVLTLYEMFLSFKEVAEIFTQIESFFGEEVYSKGSIAYWEKYTILGPILQLSPLEYHETMDNYQSFAGQKAFVKQTDLKILNESLQNQHNIILQRLFGIIDRLFRISSKSREDVLSYFAQIVNKNHLRRGEADIDPAKTELTSDATMANITVILIKFTQPFLDISYKKIDKIDINYFNNVNLFLDLSNETRINSDYKEAEQFYDQNKKQNGEDIKPNFISDCFFLTLTYLHYGIGGVLLRDEKNSPILKRMEAEYERMRNLQQQRATDANPFMKNILKIQLQKIEDEMAKFQSWKYSFQSFFSNRAIQSEVFDFVCGASTFLIRVIDPSHQYPFKQLNLPLIPDQIGVENVDNADYLRAHAPVPFKYYPEFIVEGLINYTFYISRYTNSPVIDHGSRLNSFVEFTTVILRCPEVISNPHLKGKMVQLLSMGSYKLNEVTPGFMMSIFENNELVSKNLLYALLDFYVIVEKTGSSSQFYDKFNSRYAISIILEEIYQTIPKYKQQLYLQAKNDPDFFTRFVARMLNDLTFLLDEGLTNLTEVHKINLELENINRNSTTATTPVTPEHIEDLKRKLISAEKQAKSSCGLSAKSMALFELFTGDIPRSFVTPEIVGRLAGMLNYNLESLVGPKCGELKVKDPEQYSFNPKELLKAVCTVYINLADQDDFVAAVARDTRSFKEELFKKAVFILGRRTGLVSDQFCARLLNFGKAAQTQKEQEEQEDIELGDVPDEFLDPLMYTIMVDPVTLPTSHVNIDRSTIKAHLLSDSTDPFNRSPLKLDEVIPNDDLREKIQAFIKEKRQKTK
ncbi:hypothetical protein NCAS_0E03700 [Naumovozyma castellii]|uniref:RING-type E3 ubiquitin transferase n=1 Tax=Naumovozyma castellii TaxID=27288 RepID=G0VG21_NAUCA|nr:hypothetical protein NCAS_0E03700 [Naumovozyma castellii CBS 4309]CCC70440.1 hypothetical protein NCAS_0E03700 [Naumovozyma castellii CBS 4309]